VKAYQVKSPTGIDALDIVDAPRPTPGPGEVLVRIHAAALNFRDLSVCSGRYARSVMPPNLIPLSDGAGEVVEVGAHVTRAKVGDRVAGCFFRNWPGGDAPTDLAANALGGGVDGVLAEYVVLREAALVQVPAHLSYAEAATLPCAAVTAWHALVERGRLRAGETVLVLGSGGVSVFALQLARLMGAEVIATSSDDGKLARLKELGAAHLVNYRTTPDWDVAVRAATGGRGVDQVVEVGGPGTLPRSLNALRYGGRVSLIGVLTGQAEMNPTMIMAKGADVQGIFVGSTQMFEALNRALTAGAIKPVIDRIFPFDEARAAYRHLQAGAHFGKVVIAVG
jgi:NADPH:quinone reductase-like Zn-dependent oxidoreductase